MVIKDLVKLEAKRQRDTLMLIPSENYAYREVLAVLGSVLTNKYAEGYPQRRYYQGNSVVDMVEQLAVDRAKEVFGLQHVNVQPYSGSPANLAVITALLNPGDTLMGLNLVSGGHLTHGHGASLTGKIYKSVQYGLDETGRIDYDQLEDMVKKERPKLLIAGTTAYPWNIDWQRLGEMTEGQETLVLADISHISGLVAGGVIKNPVPYVDVVTTTTHKMLRGPRGAFIGVTARGMVRDNQLSTKIDRAVFPGLQGGPHMNNIAGIAVALEKAGTPIYREYALQVLKNAKWLVEALEKRGVGVFGTDNHLLLVDAGVGGGKQLAVDLEEVGVVANANMIPGDTSTPMKPSGIRMGTPAVTARGMKEREMEQIAEIVEGVIRKVDKKRLLSRVRQLCRQYPIPE